MPAAPQALGALALVLALAVACGPSAPPEAPAAPAAAARPSILLVTLDTTRADMAGPEAADGATPNLAALARRGVWFAQAYATAPTTLPAHASMLTGLYPSEHGVHENARYLDDRHVRLAERLREAGYRTAAFVSGLPLDRRFGLARGFDTYDDEMDAGGAERDAGSTTDRALAWLAGADAGADAGGDGAADGGAGGGADGGAGGGPGSRPGSVPVFVWVHYFDPHDPYEPPEPFRSRFPESSYRGEIAYMDSQLGRLLAGFDERCAAAGCNVLVAGDHGEGLGEHGEALHGRLLYQGVMRVPLIAAGAGIAPGEVHRPVSARQVFDTILGWASAGDGPGLLAGDVERGLAGDVEPGLAGDAAPVLGEAMKPYLQYGWQPQVMAVSGRFKAIRSGAIELYDVIDDPGETRDLAEERGLPPELRQALRDYPLPRSGEEADPGETLDDATRQRLASLGYIGSGARPAPRADAPSPRRMTGLFADMDAGAALFVAERYDEAIPLLGRVLERDPGNLAVALRLAVAHSVLGRDRQAVEYLERAAAIDPGSTDLAHYTAMHYLRTGEAARAEPLLELVLARNPSRLPALRGLAEIRRRQGRPAEAAALLERALAIVGDAAPDLLRLGELAMELTDTAGAIDAFERARRLAPETFSHWLELGVCYLASRRLEEARASLDRVPPEHPAYPLALFKRAQVSVLLGEADREERIRRAWRHADAMTGPLFASEALFDGVSLR